MSTQSMTLGNRFMFNLTAYLELTKPRVNLLVVLTSAVGFCLASSGHPDFFSIVSHVLGHHAAGWRHCGA